MKDKNGIELVIGDIVVANTSEYITDEGYIFNIRDDVYATIITDNLILIRLSSEIEKINDIAKCNHISITLKINEAPCSHCGKMNDFGVNCCWWCTNKIN